MHGYRCRRFDFCFQLLVFLELLRLTTFLFKQFRRVQDEKKNSSTFIAYLLCYLRIFNLGIDEKKTNRTDETQREGQLQIVCKQRKFVRSTELIPLTIGSLSPLISISVSPIFQSLICLEFILVQGLESFQLCFPPNDLPVFPNSLNNLPSSIAQR